MIFRLVQISRPVLWVNTVGTTAMAMWLAGFLFNLDVLPLLIWSTLPFNLLIYGINDIFDQETDALNARKGGFGGAKILASEQRLIIAAVALSNLPFLAYFAFTLPLAANAWIWAYVLVFFFYSAPPLRFKARRFLDSLSNAAYALPLVFVPLALGQSPIWAAAIGLMAWSMAKHTYDAVQDIEEDRATGIRTTAVNLGVRGTVIWAAVWWAVSTVLFALVNIPVAIANLAISGWLLIKLWRNPVPETGRSIYAVSVAFPYIAGAVAGLQIVAALILGLYP